MYYTKEELEYVNDLRYKAFMRDMEMLLALGNMGKLPGRLQEECRKYIVEWYNAHADEAGIIKFE